MRAFVLCIIGVAVARDMALRERLFLQDIAPYVPLHTPHVWFEHGTHAVRIAVLAQCPTDNAVCHARSARAVCTGMLP